jgi:hypothetical protein
MRLTLKSNENVGLGFLIPTHAAGKDDSRCQLCNDRPSFTSGDDARRF